MLVHLTKDNYEKEVTKSELPVIIDFWAEWCGPCRMMAPVFEELSKEYEGRLTFAKLDTEEEPELSMKHGIRGIPTLAVMHKGKEVGKIVGFAPKAMLKSKIEGILSSL